MLSPYIICFKGENYICQLLSVIGWKLIHYIYGVNTFVGEANLQYTIYMFTLYLSAKVIFNIHFLVFFLFDVFGWLCMAILVEDIITISIDVFDILVGDINVIYWWEIQLQYQGIPYYIHLYQFILSIALGIGCFYTIIITICIVTICMSRKNQCTWYTFHFVLI